MKTKKIVAESMPLALKMVRQELGDNAIIVNTRTIKAGGIFGLFSKQKYEVTAYTLDEEPKKQEPAFTLDITQKPDRAELNRLIAGKRPEQTEEPSFPVKREGTSKYGGSAVNPESANPEAVTPELAKPELATPEFAKLELVKPKLVKTEAAKTEPVEPKTASQGNEQLLEELQDMRKMMMIMMRDRNQETPLSEELADWAKRLKKQGVEEEVIDYITTMLLKNQPDVSTDSTSIHEQIKGIIEGILKKRIPNSTSINMNVRMVNIIGPTGVGKTTSIAKLATEQVLRQKRRVAMITTDVYRIGAVEQLKTYAGILNVPIEVVRSADELETALARLAPYDLIYMDTTGRNYRELIHREAIGKYLEYPADKENFLALSLTTKYEDMAVVLNEFLESPVKKLILTKFDETTTYGSILNIAYHFPYELAYMTNGQSVPEDITAIDAKLITGYLVGDEVEDGSGTESKRIYASL
ncbi:hypothetical protein AM500_22555 [Bacillus sp. FJAT-18017]|uniref:flagellar biosynthesis protein FlhF n=1 Tax=Bacillus sp. FJAT-18017 TaxID=1705566 RepID=UPI0006AF5177|nr:flagellar biosynthesis protein FlhF [Bacillus sp. FJAT-18017]ALC92242.1 hypothetical protein AM500_22555 [Bacillus sp. FJAT-18017]